MGRVLRTTVPTTRAQRKPNIPDLTLVKTKDQQIKHRQKKDFDSHHGARELPPLQPGDHVWIPGRGSEAEVEGEVAPQSYQVVTGDGTFRRNRRDLIRLPHPDTAESAEQSGQERTDTTELSEHSNEQSIEPTTSDDSNESTTPRALRRSSRNSRPPERLDPSWSH
jgi:hypothetical protein